MFNWFRSRTDNDAVVAELTNVRETLEALQYAIEKKCETDEQNARTIAAAIRVMAETMDTQTQGNNTTTSVVLGLMRMIQQEFGHEPISITPFGMDPGKLS